MWLSAAVSEAPSVRPRNSTRGAMRALSTKGDAMSTGTATRVLPNSKWIVKMLLAGADVVDRVALAAMACWRADTRSRFAEAISASRLDSVARMCVFCRLLLQTCSSTDIAELTGRFTDSSTRGGFGGDPQEP